MFAADTATVDNSIGRLLPDTIQEREDDASSTTNALSKMQLGASATVSTAAAAVPTEHMAQSAQTPESLSFLQDRLTEKPFSMQSTATVNDSWTMDGNLAAPRGVRPMDIYGDLSMENAGTNSEPQLEATLISTLRDASSPEIDTDISRTSSTSTKGSSTESAPVWSSKSSSQYSEAPVEPGANEPGLAPSAEIATTAKEHSHTASAEEAKSQNEDKASRLQVKRLHSILELLDTERNYTEDLDMLVNVFFAQLRTLPYFMENGQRLRTVVRNADELLALHRDLTTRLNDIVERAMKADASSDAADCAVVECANTITALAPRFVVYNEFCARQKESLAHIDAVEHRAGEWELFKLRTNEAAQRFVGSSSEDASPASSTSPSPRAVTQRRLLFRDFFIKPIQRVCLYPIILQTVQKNSPGVGQKELAQAIELMRNVGLDVDRASKRRESALLTEMIGARLEYTTAFSPSLLTSLGECKMSGNLDVLHHHSRLAPLANPLPIKYYGCFLFADFLLMVKVRRNHSYTARYWFPLADARLERTEPHESYLRHAFRLTVRDHHFEMIASTAKECHLWLSALEELLGRGPAKMRRLNGADVPFPCNLISDGAAPETTEDPLRAFFAHRTLSPDSQAAGRGRATPATPHTEILLRHKSPPRRAAIDRGMLFSDACISARTSVDHDGMLSHTTLVTPSTLGSTVGSKFNLSRLSGSETLSLKLPSRAISEEPTPNVPPSMQSEDASPLESPMTTAPSSPTLRSVSSFAFPSENGELGESAGRGFRRRMRDSFSRRSSVQLDFAELVAAQEQAQQAHALSRRSSLTGLSGRSSAIVSPSASQLHLNEVGQVSKVQPPPLTIDTSDTIKTPTPTTGAASLRASLSSTRSMRENAKAFFSPTTQRFPTSPAEDSASPAGTLKRSSSLNWSALRARNWSTASLKGLAPRRGSMDLDQDLGMSEPPQCASRASLADTSRPTSALSTHAPSEAVSAPASRAPSPKRKFAMRFLQRNRISPMAPIDPHSSATCEQH